MHVRRHHRHYPIRRSRSLGPDVFERLWVDAHGIPRYHDPYRLGPHLYDSDVVVVKSRASRPVTSFDDLSLGRGSDHAQRVRDFAVDDHDSIRHASRQQDAALLGDISSRLDYYGRPHEVLHPGRLGGPLYHHHHRAHYPSYYTSEPVSPLLWRASSLPPPSSRSHHYSEDLRFPEYRPSYRISSFVRAGSVPPVGTAASSEMAIRNARRAAARVERELGSGYHDDDYTPRRAYSLGRHELDYLDDDYIPRRSLSARRHSMAYLDDEVIPLRRHVVATSPVVRRRSSSYAARPPLPVPSRYHMIEDLTSTYSPPVVPPLSLTSLRSKAADARSKMDHTKVLLDRYLPIHWGPEPEVEYQVAAKYGELADRLRRAKWSAKLFGPRSATHVSTHAKSYARPRVIRTITHTEPSLYYTFLPAKLGGFFDKQPYVGYKAWKPYKSSYVPYKSVYKPPKFKSSGYVNAQYNPLPGYKGNYKSSLYTPYVSVRSGPGCYRSCYIPLKVTRKEGGHMSCPVRVYYY